MASPGRVDYLQCRHSTDVSRFASVIPSFDRFITMRRVISGSLAVQDRCDAYKSQGVAIKIGIVGIEPPTSSAQKPFATALSCIDSRSGPELLLDQGIGDVFSPRIAGNFVNADILGSMEFASKVAGSKGIVVLGHT